MNETASEITTANVTEKTRSELFEAGSAMENALIGLGKANILLDHWTQTYSSNQKPDPLPGRMTQKKRKHTTARQLSISQHYNRRIEHNDREDAVGRFSYFENKYFRTGDKLATKHLRTIQN